MFPIPSRQNSSCQMDFPTLMVEPLLAVAASAGFGWWQWARGGSGPKPPDVNELGQWSGQWRPPEPALVAPGTRARTMRRRRIRQCSGLLHHFPPHSSTSWSCFPCARLSPLHRRGFSSPSRGAAACWFKPPQSVLGRGEAHMPSARLVDDYWQ